MIIQVRGTSGSGKSTVVRKVMEQLGEWEPEYTEGRKKPMLYRQGGVVVLGHYEGIDCGGCDTVGSAPLVFNLLESTPFTHAITEGLLWSEDVIWTTQLKQASAVLFLQTPVSECLDRVAQRQKGRDPKDPARLEAKLTYRAVRIERVRHRLLTAGVKCIQCSDRQAPGIILKWVKGAV